jgi:beta-phosphoglucomutase-like phosphatase (HAD superfamily)
VEALLQHHPQLNNCWKHWICAEDVQTKKPHPEAYVLALKKLGLLPWRQLWRSRIQPRD